MNSLEHGGKELLTLQLEPVEELDLTWELT